MNLMVTLPLVASLVFGGMTALAQEKVTENTNPAKPAQEQQVKPERPRGEKPKETHRERCLRKNNGDENKCKKLTRLERCLRKENLTKEQCEQKFKDEKARVHAERRAQGKDKLDASKENPKQTEEKPKQ